MRVGFRPTRIRAFGPDRVGHFGYTLFDLLGGSADEPAGVHDRFEVDRGEGFVVEALQEVV